MSIYVHDFDSKDFSSAKHGTFSINDGDSLTKLICGNVATHTSDMGKTEITVDWIAPQPGAGCVVFHATIMENRDFWYMDDGPLSAEFCEDEESRDDYISYVEEKCRACHEAKYEVDTSVIVFFCSPI